MRVPLLSLLFTWCVTGCGDNGALELPDVPPQVLRDGSTTPDAATRPDAATPPDAAIPPDGPSLQVRIDQAVSRISADTCFAQADTSSCQWADYGVAPNHFNMQVTTGEAILVIDDFGDGVFPQLLRYRNRLLGVYRVNGDAIEAQPVSAHVPKQLGDALVSFAGPEFIPATLLTRVSAAAAAAYSKVPLLFLGHGGVVFSHLVELAPEQPIVLLQLAGFLGLQPSLCQHMDDATMATVSAHFTAVAAALRQLMRDNHVKFVNASFGDTAQTLATDWSRTCGTTVPGPDAVRRLLHLYDPIYDALFHTTGVITAHASANLGAAADFPFDQAIPRYANRVRVGFFSSLNSGLDDVGRGTVQKAEQFPVHNSDADVFVNWDCEAFVGCADPHYELAGAFGLTTSTLVIMTTSYVDPLGLGRLINLRYANHADEAMSDSLIAALKQELTPTLCGDDGAQPCVYQDPLVHHQLEVYRQHYR